MNEVAYRILCVDDDTHSCEWISIMLRGSGVKASVVTVASGREAFFKLESEAFDLCILEYALPDMTGSQLCKLMRQRGCNVPMMFFSAMNRPIDRQNAFNAGATEYLAKPDDLEIFVDAAVRLLYKRRAIYAVEQKMQEYARAA